MPTLPYDPATISRAAFVARFSDVYEHSPWAAEQVYDTGLDADASTVEGLAAALARAVDAADHQRKMALLKAHPELAGKLAVRGELTEASSREQAGAGLDQCSPEEFEAFQSLNAAYTERFGHPFIIAVAGLDRAAILNAFRQRVENTPEAEFGTALAQVHRIARIRLERMAAEG